MARVLMSLAAATLVFVSGAFAADPPRANNNLPQDVRGRIVRVDPTKNTVVVRMGEGDAAKEMEYNVGANTRYWGTDRQALDNGLRYQGFKEGSNVWYRIGTGDNARTISEIRFFDPTLPNPNQNK